MSIKGEEGLKFFDWFFGDGTAMEVSVRRASSKRSFASPREPCPAGTAGAGERHLQPLAGALPSGARTVIAAQLLLNSCSASPPEFRRRNSMRSPSASKPPSGWTLSRRVALSAPCRETQCLPLFCEFHQRISQRFGLFETKCSRGFVRFDRLLQAYNDDSDDEEIELGEDESGEEEEEEGAE